MKENNTYRDENEPEENQSVETTIEEIEDDDRFGEEEDIISRRKRAMINDDEAITIRTHASKIISLLQEAADQRKAKGSDSDSGTIFPPTPKR